jgi:phospholipase/carboxylesterase
MNRIKISPLAMAATQENQTDRHSEQRQTVFPAGHSGQHNNPQASVFVPMHYEKNYAYPLVVWVHSAGHDASEVHEIMPRISKRNYVAVAPELGPMAGAGTLDSQSCLVIGESVVAAIETAKARFNINPSRVFIAGFGTGATMAFRVALEHPERFAGVLAMNGPLPSEGAPLSQWEQPQLCQQLKLLHIAGFSLTLRQYPGGDAISDGLLADVNRWIMEGINAPPANHPPQAR